MAAGCPAKCAKILLIIFNIIFWLSGAALCAIGIWLLVDKNVLSYFDIIYVDGSDQWFKYAAYVMIAVGVFTLITGFTGCCGAIRESPCLLGTYIFLLVIVMLVEIAVGVLAFVFRNQIEEEVQKLVGETFTKANYTKGHDADGNLLYTGFGTGMNLLQQEFKCCGIEGPTDYDVLKDKAAFDNGFPYACCQINDPDDRADTQSSDVEGDCSAAFYTDGCKESLNKWLEKNALILIGLGIGIACLEIFGIIFAVCVCRNPSSEKYE